MKRLLLYIGLVVIMLPAKGSDNNASTNTSSESDCPPDIASSEIPDFSSGIHEYLASNSISAENSISGRSTVHYGANSQVKLSKGFTVKPGCDFVADLKGCSATIIELSSEKAAHEQDGQDFEVDNTVVEFEIYPNPSSGWFKIVSSGNEVKQVDIYNTTGVLIYSNTSSDTELEIDLESIAPGLYLVKLTSTDITNTKTLVIK